MTDRTTTHAYTTPNGWNERYSDNRIGAAAPGTVTHSDAANRQFYRVKFDAVDRCLERAGATLSGKAVLDAAGGSGQFVDYFLTRNVGHVTVCDFSQVGLDLVARRYGSDPRVSTRLFDLSATTPDWPRSYDFVFVMEAIFLLPADADFLQAIGNLGAALKEGGHAIISDIFPPETTRQNPYVVRRSQAHFEHVLGLSGLRPVAYIPQTFAFNRRLFGRFQRPIEKAGPLLYWLDRAAMNLGLRPPAGSRADVKYLIARKAHTENPSMPNLSSRTR